MQSIVSPCLIIMYLLISSHQLNTLEALNAVCVSPIEFKDPGITEDKL